MKSIAEDVLNQADVISLAALSGLVFWGFLFFTQVSAAALAPDPVETLGLVWDSHRELVLLVFAAYGIIRSNGE